MRAQFLVELLPQRSTVCLAFEHENVSVNDVKNELNMKANIPIDLIQLMHNSLILDDCCVPHAPAVLKAMCGHGLLGGKGGFGAMLRSQGKGAGARATRDFGACRDLSGRRLRHVNQEVAIQKWNEEESLRAQRKRDGIDERELPQEDTPSGIPGWYLNTPSWAEGFGKKAASRMRRKRKTVMCSSWTQARARATPPPNAPVWWGCPRGENCNYAHGETELRGEELTLYKKQQKEDKIREKEKALDEYVHPVAPTVLENEVHDAFLAGLKKRAALKASQDAQKAELQTKMVFTPGESTWGSTTVISRGGSWLVPLNGNVRVHQTTQETNATVEGHGTFGTATVFGCALQEGKWYYEVELLTGGVIQVGWANGSFEADDEEGDGVGDHAASWAYDGCRQVKWTNGESTDYGEKWNAGDVIGCWIDIDNGTIGFTRNGNDMGISFSNIQGSSSSSFELSGFFPAFSLEENERIRINIGDHDFVHKMPTYRPIVVALYDECKQNDPLPRAKLKSPQKTVPVNVQLAASQAQSLIADNALDQKAQKMDVAAASSTAAELEDLMAYDSVEALMELGMDKLKQELMNRGLKCGGTLNQRAERLFAVRGKSLDEIANKFKSKP